MSLRVFHLNGQTFFNTQISVAPIRIFLYTSGENISGYFKTLILSLKKSLMKIIKSFAKKSSRMFWECCKKYWTVIFSKIDEQREHRLDTTTHTGVRVRTVLKQTNKKG